MSTYAMPTDAEGRLIGAAAEQVREMVAEAAPAVDPGVLHAATCHMNAYLPGRVLDANGAEPRRTELAIFRTGTMVRLTVGVPFGMALTTPEASIVLDQEPTDPLPYIIHTLKTTMSVTVRDADGVETKVPDATVEVQQSKGDRARWDVFFSGVPDDATITGFVYEEVGITADPAPPGSY